MSNPVDDAGNVRVDHVWGNMPMQPDDARGENTLDPALDNHIIATSGWNGFPGFIPNQAVYQDTIPNVTVPNVVNLTQAAATTAIENAGLEVDTVSTADNDAGATEANDGKVKTQTPAAGTVVNEGTEVDLVVYDYTAAAQPLTLTRGVDFTQGDLWGGGHPSNQDGLINISGGGNLSAGVADALAALVPVNSTWTVEVTYGATTLAGYTSLQAPFGGVYLEPTSPLPGTFNTTLPASVYNVSEITFDPASSTVSVVASDVSP